MPPVVLLPGLACDAHLFAAQLPALAERTWLRVSQAHQRAATLPAMAQWLWQHELARTPEPVVLVGHSMGAMLALHAQALAPQRVAGMALLCTSARADTPELQQLRRDAIVLFQQGRAEEVLRANAAFAFHPSTPAHSPLVADYLREILRMGPEALVAQNQAVLQREDFRARLGHIRCPVLVVSGERDLLTPLEHSQEIAAALPQAKLAVVPGAGHMLPWEQPEALNALLCAWVAELA